MMVDDEGAGEVGDALKPRHPSFGIIVRTSVRSREIEKARPEIEA
jgi:hypothetical protein